MVKTHIALYILDIFVLVFLCGLLSGNDLMEKHRKKSFFLGIILTILIILSELGTIIVAEGTSNLHLLNIIFNIFGFAFTPIIPIILIDIFDNNILQKHKILLLPTIINTFAVFLSPFFGFIFYINEYNHYERGSAFPLFVAICVINIIFLIIVISYAGYKTLYPIKWGIITLAFFTLAGTYIQFIIPSIYTTWHCVTLSLLLLYILLSEFDNSFDVLTKLYNRAAFEKASKKLTQKNVFSFVVMDINNVKDINDTYGHEYGDISLKTIASIINASFDNKCSCYRIGGDEFCVIRRDKKQLKLERQLKHMINSITEKRENDNRLPTIDYGYSVFTGDENLDFKKIFNEADSQMYYYKQLQAERKHKK